MILITLLFSFISCQNATSGNGVAIIITGSLELDRDIYDYNETITGTLTINEYAMDELNIEIVLNDEETSIIVNNSGQFQLTLTPDISTAYTMTARVQYGSDVAEFSYDFIVKQIPFLGTWRAEEEYSPAYPFSGYDIIGIWYIDGFELYYVDQNNNDNLLTYSAKGTMTFPEEDTWITLSEEQFYNEATGLWDDWIYSPAQFYAKYQFTEGVVKMDVFLDMTEPSDTPEYTWNFTKISDSVTPLY